MDKYKDQEALGATTVLCFMLKLKAKLFHPCSYIEGSNNHAAENSSTCLNMLKQDSAALALGLNMWAASIQYA